MQTSCSSLLVLFLGCLSLFAQAAPPAVDPARMKPIFDGRTLDGWEGDPKLWRVEDGCIVGGSLTETLKQNEFLATTKRFTNFVIRAKFKLVGTGFVNSGIQIRSERVPNNSEMAGYQCDIGDPTWWGSIYDESRRNRVLAWSDMKALEPVLKRNDWNDYVIRADGNRITTWINGVLGVDYLEPDPDIIGSGRIGFQVHGGGAAQASFKDITIEELPVRPKLQGAAEPKVPAKASPLSPEDQQATFSVPPGFKVELVAAEPDGGKFVAINFDHAGRMWTMTALEYPLDANEAGAEAKALFERGGRDKVLVFDTPTLPGRQTARTFAEGLVMPLGVLPYKGGAYVQYGDAVRFYFDSNGDGKADGFTNVLTGFGIEDSHLFPHQFTRAPGGWFWLAQGAFNYSKVKTTDGTQTDFNKTKLARWRPDGSQFETIGWGPCNIWGLVLDRHGEAFIQEANDQGWPVMPFLESASYPLCGDDVPRPYAPPFPKTGEKEMGGTGLSGLALSEGADSFPGEWRDVFFINNPITRKVQAIRVHRNSSPSPLGGERAGERGEGYGNGWQLEHLPDLVLSSDPWFRPVAMAFGPDGCLYVVDWYNQIISHNEVPRKHPERDKTRGRVWRIRHDAQPHRTEVPNLYTASDAQLLASLKAANTWEVNAAWQQITDRQAVSLAPELVKQLLDDKQPADLRIRALWAIEGLGKLELAHVEKLAKAEHRAVRKEALSTLRAGKFSIAEVARISGSHLEDRDRLVRQESMRALVEVVARPAESGRPLWPVVGQLLRTVLATPATGGSKFQGHFEAFEHYLVRRSLERQPAALQSWFAATDNRLPEETQRAWALASVTMGGAQGAAQLAVIVPELKRPLSGEELLLLAGVADQPQVAGPLKAALADPSNLRLLSDNRARLANQAALAPLLVDALRSLIAKDPSDANHALLAQLATGFKLSGLENELVTAATKPGAKPDAQLAALRALRESGSTRVDVLRQFAGSGNDAVRREAVTALAAAKSDATTPALLELWPALTPVLRKTAVDRLASSPASAKQLVAAVASGAIARDELDGYTLDKLATVLPDDATVKTLVAELGSSLRPVLRLNGDDGDWLDTELTLDGPFTVECWVKLDPGINNQDSILGAPGQFDANFYDSRFRVWIAGVNDIVTATKPMTAESWTHVAITRDAAGTFRLYLNGELDATSAAKEPRRFEKLTPFRSTTAGGTAGEFAEFRVWSVCRTADEIRSGANLAVTATVFTGSGANWGKLHGSAKIERTADFPPVQSEAEAKSLESRFAKFRTLGQQPGDLARGQQVFTTTCGVCHAVKGAGGKIGPALDGAGAHGLEAVLRNVLTPNAAMEAGYRMFRAETKDSDVIEGLLAAQDADSVTLRQPNTEDQRLLRANLKRAAFLRTSVMPEGLFDALQPQQVSDLLAYVLTLK
jgi:putative membrane-bound dehydrogenase-like protein